MLTLQFSASKAMHKKNYSIAMCRACNYTIKISCITLSIRVILKQYKYSFNHITQKQSFHNEILYGILRDSSQNIQSFSLKP